ncbi:hypothetical protein MPNT_460006 [Candidatus Methylacidithermus pantelleriae]|uniref:Uncharacterized protein n=1 Tax=Candidatus Methylacidithermus pantelleriae TaxID=2744239 RepID=A0A8J2BNK0_9BACT|nr:hypothetical protein MPNT_460006 [Candidatus Methylacidithermus pantelleriae]
MAYSALPEEFSEGIRPGDNGEMLGEELFKSLRGGLGWPVAGPGTRSVMLARNPSL